MDFEKAVLSCWSLHDEAARQARKRGNTDLGLRAGVTGGGHLDPLAEPVKNVLVDAGIPAGDIHSDRNKLELPGISAQRRGGTWWLSARASLSQR